MILIADDHALYRESIKQWLSTTYNHLQIEAVESFSTVIDFLNTEDQPDLLMLDLCMPGMNGTSSIRDIAQQWPGVPILIVSAKDDPLLMRNCIDAGAAGFLSKSSDGESMQEAIKQLLAGHCFIPQCLMHEQPLQFSKKQEAILSLLAKGHSNREISEHIHLTEGTVKQYVSDILSKLGADNRIQAGIRARAILGLN